ncbi:MAG: beta-glucosidase [Alphaproteobacteria bacterium]|nr:beta-glucosidase [Alphaproteobacteria bacterium]
MKFWDGRRFDAIRQSGHDRQAAVDYGLLAASGIRTIRDGMRWHLIERTPGAYDWSSVTRMADAALEAGVEIIWDLCHFGVPDHIDVLSREFPFRFADYAEAAAATIGRMSGNAPLWCPINEISYWSYAAGTEGFIEPAARGRAEDIKRQLVSAFLAAATRLRAVDSRARCLATDPLIHVTSRLGDSQEARAIVESSFAAWDMLLGRAAPELGGHEGAIDLLGANYFPDNQRSIDDGLVGLGCIGYRPLHVLIETLWSRYGLPILLSETGAEGANASAWLSYISREVALAVDDGIPVEGVCLYPAMDYPGWIDDRHCRCGLIRTDSACVERTVDSDVLASVVNWSAEGGS